MTGSPAAAMPAESTRIVCGRSALVMITTRVPGGKRRSISSCGASYDIPFGDWVRISASGGMGREQPDIKNEEQIAKIITAFVPQLHWILLDPTLCQ